MNGWIKIHRQITEWGWYNDSHMVHLFIHLIVSANIEEKSFKGIKIKKGELVTSVSKLAEQTGIPTQTVRTCLSRLQQSGEISRSSTNKFTVITICKYDSYQVENSAANKQMSKNQNDTQIYVDLVKNHDTQLTNKKEGLIRSKSDSYEGENFAANKQLTNNQQTKSKKSTNKKEGLTPDKSESYEDENFAANKQNSKNQQTKIAAFNNNKNNKNNIIIAAKAAGTVRDAHAREAELEIFEAGETGDTTPAKVNEITAADIEAVRLYYNEQLQAAGSTMPRAKCKLTGKREAYVRARIRQYGMQAVVEVIQQAARSEFLNGSGDRGFVADLEWIMRPNNFPKVYDGKFNIKARQQATEPTRLKQETQTRSGMSELLDEQEQETQKRQQRQRAGQQETPGTTDIEQQKSRYEGMIAIYRQNPSSYSVKPLISAYRNGTLRELGISWKPDEEIDNRIINNKNQKQK